MHNSIIQMLDFNLEVVYPIEYLQKAIHPSIAERETMLANSKFILLQSFWKELVHYSLFSHPREIASTIFREALAQTAIEQKYVAYIQSGILGINTTETNFYLD